MPPAPAPNGRPALRGRRASAPEPPWGAFPLVELCVLAAGALVVAGVVWGGDGGKVLFGAAALLGCVAGLEVAIREHLGGYRSHTLVLSAAVGVVALGALFFAGVHQQTRMTVAIAVFAGAFLVLRELFKRRSGGVGFRVR